MSQPTSGGDPGEWDRRRLLLGLAGAITAVVLLTVGLGYTVYFTFFAARPVSTATLSSDASEVEGGGGGGDWTNPGRARGDQYRDQVAAAAMLTVVPDDALAGTPAAVAGPTFTVPVSTRMGPASVPTGFPHTAAGAVAQLAAIDTVVLGSMSIAVTNAVHSAWAMPGGAEVGDWEMTRNVQSFLASAQLGPEKDLATTVSATPAAAQVKGTDGPDWVLACVLFDVRATVIVEARMGYGHCERMQWNRTGNASRSEPGRWMIAPGTAPAPAPSTWPGTQISFDAGWRTWLNGPEPTRTGTQPW